MADSNRQSPEDVGMANAPAKPPATPEEREKFMEQKFANMLLQEKRTLRSFYSAQEKGATNWLVDRGVQVVLTAWFEWEVHVNVWAYFSAAGSLQSSLIDFPWIYEEPRMAPASPADASQLFAEFRRAIIQENNLPALVRIEKSLPLMGFEPEMPRNFQGSNRGLDIALRQNIWDDVFLGEPCVPGHPFEVVIPFIERLRTHGVWGSLELLRYLPAAVHHGVISRLNPSGHYVPTLVLGLAPNASDNPMNRMNLALSYNIALNWARTVVVTGTICPVSHAFKNFMIKPVQKEGEDVSQVVGLAEQREFTDDELKRCEPALALMPWTSEADHAAYRVGLWLQQQIDLTTVQDRYRLLREWCQQKHTNLENLTPIELRYACHRAWEKKITEWMTERDITKWSWNMETYYARQIATADSLKRNRS
ncbi:hypothetical protein CKAH01_04614 [Colletotrichum kahawae]|uniref:Uncharacterized protein n=1 Tax=Colletotrichum kahawae TaxID=34407 RepID=A0AAD9YH00_COLKA|nr:hypothetical protein CKAH01_04614 [Colletotrichum kahawae]